MSTEDYASFEVSVTEKTRPAAVRDGADGRTEAPVLNPFWRLRLIAFCVGAASLGAEIATTRLLAPYFDTSTII